MSCLDALNPTSLDTLCAALCYAIDIEPPKHAAAPNEALVRFVDEAFGGQKCDRLFMYNPDAVAQWLFEKYEYLFQEVMDRSQLQLPLRSPMPPVTPVCFGTMYTGAQPEVHGILKYEKPVITIDTLFDALLRAGKKPAIVSTAGDSLSRIFLEREMDYFIYDTVEQVNAKAAELILRDEHDFILVYNGSLVVFGRFTLLEADRACALWYLAARCVPTPMIGRWMISTQWISLRASVKRKLSFTSMIWTRIL